MAQAVHHTVEGRLLHIHRPMRQPRLQQHTSCVSAGCDVFLSCCGSMEYSSVRARSRLERSAASILDTCLGAGEAMRRR